MGTLYSERKYDTVIGLEVHVQLGTDTKVFCGCSTAFGAEPNTHVCPVCMGMPGVLPVLNRKAFEYSIKVALALNCDIQKTLKFDRKNYYYPDLPKNYQITQFDMPLAFGGEISIIGEDGKQKNIEITRAHMEEDAGKLLHDQEPLFSYVDLNRTGTPLLEIVSEPVIKAPAEAYEYLVNLKQIIKYVGVSDCNMEEGSLRCDANISLRVRGVKELGNKVEIKNMNSFKAVRDALAFEADRQEDMLDNNERIPVETRLWDEKKNVTGTMRSKEEAMDYRYFPEPDLVPFEVKSELIEEIRKSMPELPAIKRQRFMDQYSLEASDADLMTSEIELADYFESVAAFYDGPRDVCNWIKGDVMKNMNERGAGISELGLDASVLAKIMKMTKDGAISRLAAKEVLKTHLSTGRSPEDIVKESGLEQVSDASELGSVIDSVVNDNEKSVNDFISGKENALGFLVGQVMKETKGKANPKMVNEMLRNKLTKQV